MPLLPTPLPLARAALARAWLGEPAVAAPLGEVELRPHQADAVARVRTAFEEFGGALLADAVGLGKTYVALAVAAGAGTGGGGTLVVAPAALAGMWREAARRAGVACELTSFERLSRGARVAGGRALVVVDEAHHARNPATVRYRALATLAAGARVLLLSATPVHNRRRDLDALLALFLGARAAALGEDEVARCVVRRTHAAGRAEALGVPAVEPVEWLPAAGGDGGLLDALLALPPPVPPADGGDGGALLTAGLVRQWASSDGALRAALRRRMARGAAILSALESGLHPSAAELRAWAAGDDGESGAVQLAFAELLCATPAASVALLGAARAQREAVRALLADLARHPDRDAQRAAHLREVRRRHAGAKVVAFAASADTVRALYRRLAGDPRVAALTARGAVVAGGAIGRAEALARFAPSAGGAPAPAECDRVDLLLATDLLSEGVNLQDASVVVHLDMPWTPARLEQRVGRVARMGSPHARVHVYALRPPASAAALLDVERRLAEKLHSAGRAVGVGGAIMPGLASWLGARAIAGAPEQHQSIRQQLERWLGHTAAVVALPATPSSLVAAVRAPTRGWIALGGDRSTLVAALADGEPTDEPALVARAISLAGGPEAEVDLAAAEDAVEAVRRWRARRAGAAAAGARGAVSTRDRRLVLQRIARITRRAPSHLRPSLAELALDARQAAAATHGAGTEARFAELARAELPDLAWLEAVGTLRPPRVLPDESEEERPAAVLLLLVDDAGDGGNSRPHLFPLPRRL
ncbi:MAG TPA: DEAD/DEAH box helicase [Gemmatimonadaceae bacterium]|nr:DEAD/DEAH box helicase [Gemmatimonadaceae bacterium]